MLGILVLEGRTKRFLDELEKVLKADERFIGENNQFMQYVDSNGIFQPRMAAVISEPFTGYVKAIVGPNLGKKESF